MNILNIIEDNKQYNINNYLNKILHFINCRLEIMILIFYDVIYILIWINIYYSRINIIYNTALLFLTILFNYDI